LNRKHIIADGVITIVERISKLENGMEPVEYFKPSKTAQNAINFITNKNLDELKNSREEEIVNIFRCLNVICGIEDTEDVIANFFKNNKEPLSIIY
jgi:aspartate carbamoyltransferase regulatory subunit